MCCGIPLLNSEDLVETGEANHRETMQAPVAHNESIGLPVASALQVAGRKRGLDVGNNGQESSEIPAAKRQHPATSGFAAAPENSSAGVGEAQEPAVGLGCASQPMPPPGTKCCTPPCVKAAHQPDATPAMQSSGSSGSSFEEIWLALTSSNSALTMSNSAPSELAQSRPQSHHTPVQGAEGHGASGLAVHTPLQFRAGSTPCIVNEADTHPTPESQHLSVGNYDSQQSTMMSSDHEDTLGPLEDLQVLTQALEDSMAQLVVADACFKAKLKPVKACNTQQPQSRKEQREQQGLMRDNAVQYPDQVLRAGCEGQQRQPRMQGDCPGPLAERMTCAHRPVKRRFGDVTTSHRDA